MNRNALYHERLYRGAELMQRLNEFRIAVCGAGALGANITENLSRQGFNRIRLIDRDRVEERNLSTQPYFMADIGSFKAKILSNALYRAVAVEIEAKAEELTANNASRLLKDVDLVIDTFDNSKSRRLVTDHCSETGVACLHVGLSRDYAEVIWNDVYRVPSNANDDVCDYPLARNLIALTVSVGCEVVIRFIEQNEQESYTITLGDFAVRMMFTEGDESGSGAVNRTESSTRERHRR